MEQCGRNAPRTLKRRFAPDAWDPYGEASLPFFSIRKDSRACSKTAKDCRGYNALPSRPRASVRNPCFFLLLFVALWLRVRAPGLLGRFGITENRLDWLLDRNQRIQNPWYCMYRKFLRRDSTASLPEQHRVSVDRENPPLANA